MLRENLMLQFKFELHRNYIGKAGAPSGLYTSTPIYRIKPPIFWGFIITTLVSFNTSQLLGFSVKLLSLAAKAADCMYDFHISPY